MNGEESVTSKTAPFFLLLKALFHVSKYDRSKFFFGGSYKLAMICFGLTPPRFLVLTKKNYPAYLMNSA